MNFGPVMGIGRAFGLTGCGWIEVVLRLSRENTDRAQTQTKN
jgi:hypothetical protein